MRLSKDEFMLLLVYTLLSEIDYDEITFNHMKDTPIDISNPLIVPKDLIGELYKKYNEWENDNE